MTDRQQLSRFDESRSPDQHSRDAWFRRGVLVALCFVMIVAANVPPDLASFGFQNDKLNHALALAILTPLAIWALPNTGPVPIFVGLALFNAGIEISQAVVGLGRAPDVIDWLTGTLVSLVVLALANSLGMMPRKGKR